MDSSFKCRSEEISTKEKVVFFVGLGHLHLLQAPLIHLKNWKTEEKAVVLKICGPIPALGLASGVAAKDQANARVQAASKKASMELTFHVHFSGIAKVYIQTNPENLWVAFSILGLKVGSFASHISQIRKKTMRIMRIMRLIGFVDFLRVWRSL